MYAIAVKGFRLGAHDADDVFQEVFVRVYDRLGTLRNDDAIRAWIAQLTRRLCVDRLRASRREAPSELVVSDLADIDDLLAELEEAMTVRDALETLGDMCSEMLDRFFCRDESYKTIGDALDLPPGTIASRISRCLTKLRLEVEGR